MHPLWIFEDGFSSPIPCDTVRDMTAILHSFLLVALAEMGDKTQLLAFVLATRFRKPWAILAGILVATILNHLLAATAGQLISRSIPPQYLQWILAAVFMGFAAWILIPDKDDEEAQAGRLGAFLTTLITFFLAEMGDKTQLSTVALSARFPDLVQVTAGTTLGMLFSDGLAVIFGERLTQRISMNWIRRFAALLFFGFGIGILAGF
jgi:putative Ca2+/H+ antiporter (TMEM165/GDT1 family)